MRRLARITAIAAALLALGCVAAYGFDQITLLSRAGSGSTGIDLADGNLRVSWSPRVPYRPAWAGQTNRLGFRYNVYSDGSGYAWAPLWSIAAVACAAALAAGYAARPRPTRPGLCPTCRYDLRASPGQCPECGHTRAKAS